MSVYTYTTFDDPFATNTQAYGINSSGQISGFYGSAGGNHAPAASPLHQCQRALCWLGMEPIETAPRPQKPT